MRLVLLIIATSFFSCNPNCNTVDVIETPVVIDDEFSTMIEPEGGIRETIFRCNDVEIGRCMDKYSVSPYVTIVFDGVKYKCIGEPIDVMDEHYRIVNLQKK